MNSLRTLDDLASSRVNSITFLRLIAALAVIYAHAYAIVASGGQDIVARVTGYAHAGGVAVDFFFLLSGYLVSGSILRQGILGYFFSRAIRLFPALWIHLLLVVFVLGPIVTTLPLSEYFSSGQTWRYIASIGSGWQSEWFLPGVFSENRNQAVNGSIWSVILEMRMYLYLGLAYILGILRSRAIFNACASILVVVVWSDIVKVPGLNSATDAHVGMLFLIGCIMYMNRDLVVVTPMTLLGAVFLAAIAHGTNKFPYAYMFVLVCVFCLVSFLSFGSWVDRLGDYSYGVYLWGWPVQQMVAQAWPEADAIQNGLVSMLVALALAIASWHFLESKALKLKNHFFRILQRHSDLKKMDAAA